MGMYNLAQIYEGGEGIEKDLAKAIELYEKSVELNNSYSMNNLAFIYEVGNEIIKKDSKKAISLYEKAAKLNNSSAIYNLALIYEKGDGVIEKNLEKAIELYENSANLKDLDSIVNLALIYKNRSTLDLEKAAHYILLAHQINPSNDKYL